MCSLVMSVQTRDLRIINKWGIFITAKPFKFPVLCTSHVRNLGARAYRKFNAAKSFGGIS